MDIIFANFWTWLGAVILLGTVLNGVADIIKAARSRRAPERKVHRYKFKDGSETFTAEGVSAEELKEIVADFARGGLPTQNREGGGEA